MTWTEKRGMEIDKLLKLIEIKYSITKEQLISRSRKSNFVMARRLCMNILFDLYQSDNMTDKDISSTVARDRCSFIYNRKEHQNEYDTYKLYKTNYDNFKKDFLSALN